MCVDEVVNELNEWIKANGIADYVPLNGSGETTLNSRFHDVIRFARDYSEIKTALKIQK